MRGPSTAIVAGTLLALSFTTPARADAQGEGWERIPSPPFDYPAGVPCAFAIHADPVVDAVYYKTLTTYPDGSVHTEAATGPLVYRLTNVSTGATVRGNASASGTATHHEDGAVTMRNHGPLLVAFRAGQGNLPPGYYQLDGPNWRLDISATNYRTVSGDYRIAKDLCAALSQ
ncbi:hypothetical protein [Actinoplanes sp. NBRC 101535]|uniref:hypothetical protein n=1 Tax=Actinoplanes sp. NBRC 101535 TaxID=3032196 RepID=UPI0024A2143D|nr:hypothetical protein [Actinoplanes sp. NBRC 101535]GLY07839.1 hypothetical protein Acsp01_82180 [Actinoplanes sp. NBRC 101535]